MRIFKVTTKKPRKDGKNSWPEIGTLFMNDQGQISGFLNNNPEVQVYLFEQQPKQGNNQPPAQENPPQENNFNDMGVRF